METRNVFGTALHPVNPVHPVKSLKTEEMDRIGRMNRMEADLSSDTRIEVGRRQRLRAQVDPGTARPSQSAMREWWIDPAFHPVNPVHPVQFFKARPADIAPFPLEREWLL
jgi:hypothetical protein